MAFEYLKDTEPGDYGSILPAAEKHLERLGRIKASFKDVAGEAFVGEYFDVFEVTGAPLVVNLDMNVSHVAGDGLDMMLKEAPRLTDEMREVVRATAGHVAGYKLNEQAVLTFLLGGAPRFVEEARAIYREVVGIDPVIWDDEKIRDIPSTDYQTSRILLGLGFSALHCMPQIGRDVSGSMQLAAEELGGKGTVHVINMTHPGYAGVKAEYLKPDAIDLMRKDALGERDPVEVDIGDKKRGKISVNIRSTATIEPANRPDEIFEARRDRYGERILIVSIGIGPQGALPGCALYADADIEGIGRFIFMGKDGPETPENMAKKARACKRGGLLALGANYTGGEYPLDRVMAELEGFSPSIGDATKAGLDRVYKMRKGQ